eukprot:COSAG02_NODE_63710_length_262_cov_0.963190_1_plen_46_part_01
MLYQAGHADIFERCYSLGDGDMLGAIEATSNYNLSREGPSCEIDCH